MNFLIDTHVLIWFISGSENLPAKTKKLIEESENCFVSIASLWELAIKHSLKRLDLRVSLEEIFAIIERSGFEILPISTDHVLVNASLAFHHRDPFDRLTIAQAIGENLMIISKDQEFKKYEVNVHWE